MNAERDTERLRFTDKRLADLWPTIATLFEQNFPGSSAGITATGGYRTPDDQKEAHADGASGFDGQTRFSKHEFFPARALDFAVYEGGKYVTNGQDPRYAWIGQEFEREGFGWGGRFRHRPDWDHVEIPGFSPTKDVVLDGYANFKKLEGTDVQTA